MGDVCRKYVMYNDACLYHIIGIRNNDRQAHTMKTIKLAMIYCWGCSTTQLMKGEISPIWKDRTLYKCPNCGFVNTEITRPKE